MSKTESKSTCPNCGAELTITCAACADKKADTGARFRNKRALGFIHLGEHGDFSLFCDMDVATWLHAIGADHGDNGSSNRRPTRNSLLNWRGVHPDVVRQGRPALFVAAAIAAERGLIDPVWPWLDKGPRWPHKNPEAVYLGGYNSTSDYDNDHELWLLAGTPEWTADGEHCKGSNRHLDNVYGRRAIARAREAGLLPPEEKRDKHADRIRKAHRDSIAHHEENLAKLRRGDADLSLGVLNCPMCTVSRDGDVGDTCGDCPYHGERLSGYDCCDGVYQPLAIIAGRTPDHVTGALLTAQENLVQWLKDFDIEGWLRANGKATR